MTNLKMLASQSDTYCIPSRPVIPRPPREIGFVPEVLEPALKAAASVVAFVFVLALSMFFCGLVGALAGPMGIFVGLLFGAVIGIVAPFMPDNR